MGICNLSEDIISSFKDAKKLMRGANRREYIASITKKLLNGNARLAEHTFGWGRKTVEKGIRELETGIKCKDNYSARGNKRTEEKIPEFVDDIRSLVDPKSQADPKLKTTLVYTRITAKEVRQALIDHKGYTDCELPCENTIGNILNRLGYQLRRVQKTKPLKKIPETDAIFGNIEEVKREENDNPETLEVSIDTKAKVNIGEFSRNGKSRGEESEKALDHDVEPDAKLVPFGLLEPTNGFLTILFGTSNETSDFIVDCLEQWWEENKYRHSHIKTLVINSDNGPHINSHRTQFIKRITDFADKTGLNIRLVYYPPYHSKYNPIERCWGVLEEHWNGTLLSSIDKAVKWAESMTWKGVHPVVNLIDKVYQHGVKLTKQAMKVYEERIVRSKNLPKWDVTIKPKFG